MTEQELKIIAELYGNICDCSPTDDYMAEHCSGWCEEHCGKVEDWQCLKKYIEEKQNDKGRSNKRIESVA